MAALRHFFAHVVGETYRNADGSDREAIITRCEVGESLTLEHEPDNPHDINAIRVLRLSGEQIGYLERRLAGEVASRGAKGWQYHAVIAGIGRARSVGPYGVALLIVVDSEGTNAATIKAYARSVLDEERRAEQGTASAGRIVPRRDPMPRTPAPRGGAWGWWVIPVAILAAVVGALILVAVVLR